MKIITDFKEWANRKCWEYFKASDGNKAYRLLRHKNKTCIINLNNGHLGMSQCHKDDIYKDIIGIAVAWAHYKGEEVPCQLKSVILKDLKPQDTYYFIDDFNETKEYRVIGYLTEDVIVVYDVKNNYIERVSGFTKVYIKE